MQVSGTHSSRQSLPRLPYSSALIECKPNTIPPCCNAHCLHSVNLRSFSSLSLFACVLCAATWDQDPGAAPQSTYMHCLVARQDSTHLHTRSGCLYHKPRVSALLLMQAGTKQTTLHAAPGREPHHNTSVLQEVMLVVQSYQLVRASCPKVLRLRLLYERILHNTPPSTQRQLILWGNRHWFNF